ncbi:MAG: DEAD/DEAH box helicase [Lewinellaceae bacterium]|nr:DEAD/DEAH box helicase [Saprospiraceae bacterium]MCB9339539.1 DEAD/DEAH box helicase [Lewinellaceae bacterium]
MFLKNFENSFNPTILQRGNTLYRQKKFVYIENDEEDPTEWHALVEGTHDEYEVFAVVQPNGEITDYDCECPHDWGGPCKHLAAFFFELRERIMNMFTQVNVVPAKIASLTAEEMMAAYEKLDETSKKLLKIAAVLWEATSQSKLAEIFNTANFKHEGKNIYPKDIKPLLEKLVKSGLLTLTGNTQYRAPEHLSNALCDRYFDQDLDFKKSIPAIRRLVALNQYWYGYTEPDRFFREMRLGRYLNEVAVFQSSFNSLLNLHPRKFTQQNLTEYWIGNTFDKARLESLPVNIRTFLLNSHLSLATLELQHLDGYFLYATDLVGMVKREEDRQQLALLLAQLNLLKGDWNQVEKLSQYLRPVIQGAFAGIGLLLAGKTELALETFDLAQKEQRRSSGSNKDVLNHLAGIFHILAYLKTKDQKYYKKIHTHTRQAQHIRTAYHPVYDWLEAVVLFLENNKPSAEQVLRNCQSRPMFDLFKYLCQFWVDELLLDQLELASNCKACHEKGYHWLAGEMNAILGELGRPIAQVPMPVGEPLCQVLPRIEEWENALKVLLDLGGKASALKTGNETDRIVWLVNFEVGTVQARHQTMNKAGWGKGRAVSYDRLRKGEVPALTPQDERFVSAIPYAWGSDINLSHHQEIFKHLVGHPLLFLEKSPSTAVQLVESKPMLIAQKTGKGYQLQFSQNIHSVGAKIVKESPTRYLFVEANEQIVQIARAFNGKSLHVPEKGAEQLKEAITGLANFVQVQSAFEDENLPTVQADSRPCVHLLPIGNSFHVEVYVKPFLDIPPYVKPGEGEPYLIAPVKGVRTATNRNLKAEAANLKALRERVEVLKKRRPSSGIWELEDAETCLELLLQLKPLLEAGEIILEWPKGEKFRIDSVVGFDQFKMSVNEKGTWFEVNGELRVDEEKVLTMQELLALSEQQSQFVEVGPGKFLALTEEFRKRLRSINGLLASQKKGGPLQLHPLAANAFETFSEAVKDFSASQKFLDNKERLSKAFSQKHKVPKAFNAELRPYQQEGFQWLHRCANWGVGTCLADDMGLGKTIQALAFLTDRASLGPALVVAPASVCRNWRAETERFAPTLSPLLFGEGDRAATIQKAKKGDLVIVTYDLMAREEKLFTEKKWATIILDEAQAIKNRATRRSEVAMQLQGDFKMAMSGTPIENHLGELWNLFQFLNPGLLGGIESFSERFSGPIEKYKDENRREQLKRLVQPFILRRRKDEVLKDLPEKTEITLTVELPPDERAFYEALRRNALEKLLATEDDGQAGQQHLRILAEIMKLRRAACHPALADEKAGFVSSAKLELFGEIVGELLENGHKALVFSQFVGHLAILEDYLKKQKIAYQYLDGSTPLNKREERINAFQSGEGDVFLISLKAGGTGLNLTAADYVIHTDPWWNPAVEDQATDRAHRIGQERPVTVYRLVAENTIEEKILELHSKKRDLADSLLAGTDVSAKLTAEELMGLLKDGI